MRWILLASILALTACGSNYHELPHTTSSDPIWHLNPGKWTFNENALTQPASEVSHDR